MKVHSVFKPTYIIVILYTCYQGKNQDDIYRHSFDLLFSRHTTNWQIKGRVFCYELG
jgi:hypothetical protein